jgi:hypothetical protein
VDGIYAHATLSSVQHHLHVDADTCACIRFANSTYIHGVADTSTSTCADISMDTSDS